MSKPQPLLTIKISGPGVKPGCVALPVLLKICHEAQEAVNRQAQAIELKISGKPMTEAARQGCMLELIALKRGSTALEFAPASRRPSLLSEMASIGVEAVGAVATTLRAVNQKGGRGGRRWRAPDPRVLDALEELGAVFDAGITKLQWIAPSYNRHRGATAEFAPEVLPKIRRRKQESFLLESGLPVALPVQESSDPSLLSSPSQESFLAPVLFSASFFTHKTLETLRVEQGVPLVTDIDALGGLIPEEDLDEFVAGIYRDREA